MAVRYTGLVYQLTNCTIDDNSIPNLAYPEDSDYPTMQENNVPYEATIIPNKGYIIDYVMVTSSKNGGMEHDVTASTYDPETNTISNINGGDANIRITAIAIDPNAPVITVTPKNKNSGTSHVNFVTGQLGKAAGGTTKGKKEKEEESANNVSKYSKNITVSVQAIESSVITHSRDKGQLTEALSSENCEIEISTDPKPSRPPVPDGPSTPEPQH